MSERRPGKARLLAAHANAICYSGYREGQSPRTGVYPSYEEIREDLRILAENWRHIRLYDASPHAETTLRVIEEEGLDLTVMLGAELAAELSNPHCPWDAHYDDATLAAHRRRNDAEVERAIVLANRYSDIVAAVAVGNECAVSWTDHLVPVERLVRHVRRVKRAVSQPVTSCDNYVPWLGTLDPLVPEVDFISIHTYPVWEHHTIETAIGYTIANHAAVVERHPNTPVVITEAGWTTASDGRGIDPANASEELQRVYYEQLMEWTNRERILTYVFEAFDEPWKGAPNTLEPEKHWGLFNVDRTTKLVMQSRYAVFES